MSKLNKSEQHKDYELKLEGKQIDHVVVYNFLLSIYFTDGSYFETFSTELPLQYDFRN
jgi:hypothetical protein